MEESPSEFCKQYEGRTCANINSFHISQVVHKRKKTAWERRRNINGCVCVGGGGGGGGEVAEPIELTAFRQGSLLSTLDLVASFLTGWVSVSLM